jgi:hypothetical protein
MWCILEWQDNTHFEHYSAVLVQHIKRLGMQLNVIQMLILLQHILDYFFSIIEKLYHIDVKQDVSLNGRRIVSALTVLCCLNSMIMRMDIPFEPVAALLSMLCPMPDVERMLCADWDLVNTMLPESMKKMTFDAVRRFISYLSGHKPLSNPEWMFALPVAHFLDGRTQPYHSMEHIPRSIPWDDKVLGLGYSVKRLTKDKEFEYVTMLRGSSSDDTGFWLYACV